VGYLSVCDAGLGKSYFPHTVKGTGKVAVQAMCLSVKQHDRMVYANRAGTFQKGIEAGDRYDHPGG